MKILFAGEDLAPGSGRYLLGVFRAIGAQVTHVPSSDRLHARVFNRPYDAIILSDFPQAHAPKRAQQIIAAQVADRTGLLMIGGWGSFSGPLGHWQDSIIETLLPITCLSRDDRLNFPSGALIVPKSHHPMWHGMSFGAPAAICGLNRVRPRPESQVLLCARKIVMSRQSLATDRLRLEPVEHPLLVIGTNPGRRVAALATDAAPHWCGGFIDWGSRSVTLPVTANIRAEVGDRYVRFFSCLVRWLARQR